MTDASPDLRVLHVLGPLRRSGAERMLLAADEQFRQAGIAGEVLSLADAAVGGLDGAFSEAGFAVHHLPTSGTFAAFVRGYGRLLRSRRPSCVHVHAEHRSLVTELVARILGIAVVRTVHSSFNFGPVLSCRKRLERWLARRVGVVFVSVSESVRQNELTRFDNGSQLVWNWIDDRHLRPPIAEERANARTALDLHAGDRAVAVVGNCGPAKDHAALFRAIAHLPTERRPVVLHVGDETADPHEGDLVRALGISDHVRFLGSIDDVRPILFAADLFVMPSRYEGLGNAALEALAVGLPVTLADVPGLRDLGRLFPDVTMTTTDPAALAAALTGCGHVAADRQQQQVRVVKKWFGLERGVAEYVRLYSKAVPAPLPALAAGGAGSL